MKIKERQEIKEIVKELRKYGYKRKIDLRKKISRGRIKTIKKKHLQLVKHLEAYQKTRIYKKVKESNKGFFKKLKKSYGLTGFSSYFVPHFTKISQDKKKGVRVVNIWGNSAYFIKIDKNFSYKVSDSEQFNYDKIYIDVYSQILEILENHKVVENYKIFAMKTGNYYSNELNQYKDREDLAEQVTDFFLNMLTEVNNYYNQSIVIQEVFNGIYLIGGISEQHLKKVEELRKQVNKKRY